MNVLVTGGAGFIGSVLCTKLVNMGWNVHCLDNFSNSTPRSIQHLINEPNFSFEKYDVSNYYLTKSFNYEFIIHLAGLVGFPQCANQQSLSRIWNIDSTKNMIALAKNGNAKIIFASTGSVYGKIDGVCSENSKTNPVSHYGIHKLEAEQLMYCSEGISLRFATGFGCSYSPRFDLLPNNLVYTALKDRCLSIFEPNARRTFIPVQEMANAIIHTMYNFKNAKYYVYNVGHESLNMTKLELVSKIEKHIQFDKFFIDNKDPDMRDYEVNYSRFREFGYEVKCDMDQEIANLVKNWRMYV